MIQVYGREGCAPCRTLKQFLTLKKIPFEYKNAVGEEYERLSAKYGFTVPLIFNGEEGFCGYDPMRLLKLTQ